MTHFKAKYWVKSTNRVVFSLSHISVADDAFSAVLFWSGFTFTSRQWLQPAGATCWVTLHQHSNMLCSASSALLFPISHVSLLFPISLERWRLIRMSIPASDFEELTVLIWSWIFNTLSLKLNINISQSYWFVWLLITLTIVPVRQFAFLLMLAVLLQYVFAVFVKKVKNFYLV